LYPPLSKVQILMYQYNEIVKNDSLPIEAFTEIMLALVKKPMKPFLNDIVKNIELSINMINPDGDDDSDIFESCQYFKWCGLLSGT
jgi:hypothetical protein